MNDVCVVMGCICIILLDVLFSRIIRIFLYYSRIIRIFCIILFLVKFKFLISLGGLKLTVYLVHRYIVYLIL